MQSIMVSPLNKVLIEKSFLVISIITHCQFLSEIFKSLYMCGMQWHNGDGGAVGNSRGYEVKLDALSTTGSIPAYKLPGDSMETTLYSPHID